MSHVKRTPFANWPCSIARAVDLLGDWWTPLILREAYYGTRRFDDFQQNLQIGRNILSQRLARLVEEGIFDKVPYQDRPLRHEYRLTDKGRDFFGVLMAMMAWGDRWLATEDGPPVQLHHRPCGHASHAEVVCSECKEPLELRDVAARLGPGFPAKLRPKVERMERFAGPTAS